MRAIYFNEKENNKISIEDIKDDIDVFYKMLDCRAFDMPYRKIGNKHYIIICDDEGLLTNRAVSAVNLDRKEVMLVGSLLIVNYAHDGNITGLDDVDIATILSHCYETKDGVKLIDLDY